VIPNFDEIKYITRRNFFHIHKIPLKAKSSKELELLNKNKKKKKEGRVETEI